MKSGVRNTFFSYYWGILILLVTLIGVTPILKIPRNVITTIILFLVAFIFCISTRPFKLHPRVLHCSLAYVLLIFIYKLLGISDAAWGNYMNQLFFFVPILMMLMIPQKMSKRFIVVTLLGVICIMLFNIANNIRLITLHPELSLANIYLKEEDLGPMNVGGSFFHSFVLMFFNVCLLFYLNVEKLFVKWGMLFMGVIAAYYILFCCLKATIVLYFFLSIILMIAAKRAKNYKKTITILLFVGMFLYGLIEILKPELIQLVITFSPDERLTRRLTTLLDSESNLASQGTISGRTNLYLLSIETWLKNPIYFLFGIGDHRSAHDALSTGIGQHSDIFDNLARYGLVGGILIYMLFKDAFKYLVNLFEKNIHPQIVVIIIIFIICAMTKSIINACVSSVVFMMLPMSSVFMNICNKNK